MFEVRHMLEAAMIRRAATELTPAQIAELRAHLRDEQAAVQRTDVSGRTRLLADFHVVLARMLGNEVLADLLRRPGVALLADRADVPVGALGRTLATPSTWPSSTRCEKRDARAAVKLMEDHLHHVERNLQLDPRVPDLEAVLLPRTDTCTPMTPRIPTPRLPARPASATAATCRMRAGRAAPASRVQFVLNYEEGGENNPLHGDPTSETFLSELVTAQAYENRHMTMESMYEYGSRVGVWRILREFEQRGLPLTVFGVGMALQRYPELLAVLHGERLRDRQPRPALDPLPEPARGDRAPPHRHRHARAEGADRRRLAARLVHRPRQPQHAPPGRRPGRLRVRQRLLRRRPAVLDARSPRATAARCRTSSCPTRSTPTTCASCRRRASTPATTSSPTCATASTRSTPRATRPGWTGRR